MRKKKKSLTRTVEDYAGRTSIHGVGYVFDKEAGHLDRVLWLLVTFAFLGLAVSLTWNTWTQWRDEQVVTFKILRHCNTSDVEHFVFAQGFVLISIDSIWPGRDHLEEHFQTSD